MATPLLSDLAHVHMRDADLALLHGEARALPADGPACATLSHAFVADFLAARHARCAALYAGGGSASSSSGSSGSSGSGGSRRCARLVTVRLSGDDQFH